jgi:hypothetical protein
MTAPVSNKSSYAFAQHMQRVWTDHAIWTRNFIVAAVDERPEVTEAAARWLRCGDEFGTTLDEYYSRRTARRVAKLLQRHVTVAIDLVEAARHGDRTKYGDIDSVWASNGEEFVDELCARNLSWAREELVFKWDLVRSLTRRDLAARLEPNFDHDVDLFDQLLTANISFGDVVTDGILRQFADRFAA